MIGTYIQLISFSSISIVIPYNFARVLKFFFAGLGHDHIFYAHRTVTFILLLLYNCNYFHTPSQNSSIFVTQT
jgi:hypothetical protein